MKRDRRARGGIPPWHLPLHIGDREQAAEVAAVLAALPLGG
jgi:hypothetical protein